MDTFSIITGHDSRKFDLSIYVLDLIHKTSMGTTLAMYFTCKPLYKIWVTTGPVSIIRTMMTRHAAEYYSHSPSYQPLQWGIAHGSPTIYSRLAIDSGVGTYYSLCGLPSCKTLYCDVFSARLRCLYTGPGITSYESVLFRHDIINDIEYSLHFIDIKDTETAIKYTYNCDLIPRTYFHLIIKVTAGPRDNRITYEGRLEIYDAIVLSTIDNTWFKYCPYHETRIFHSDQADIIGYNLCNIIRYMRSADIDSAAYMSSAFKATFMDRY